MTKRYKMILGVVISGLAFFGLFSWLILGKPDKGSLVSAIPLLTALSPNEELETLSRFYPGAGSNVDTKSLISEYKLNRGFKEVNDEMRVQLKSWASSGVVFPTQNPSMIQYSIATPQQKNNSTVIVQELGPSHTLVRVTESLPVTSLDRLRLFWKNLSSARRTSVVTLEKQIVSR